MKDPYPLSEAEKDARRKIVAVMETLDKKGQELVIRFVQRVYLKERVEPYDKP